MGTRLRARAVAGPQCQWAQAARVHVAEVTTAAVTLSSPSCRTGATSSQGTPRATVAWPSWCAITRRCSSSPLGRPWLLPAPGYAPLLPRPGVSTLRASLGGGLGSLFERQWHHRSRVCDHTPALPPLPPARGQGSVRCHHPRPRKPARRGVPHGSPGQAHQPLPASKAPGPQAEPGRESWKPVRGGARGGEEGPGRQSG